jgi:aspartokinase
VDTLNATHTSALVLAERDATRYKQVKDAFDLLKQKYSNVKALRVATVREMEELRVLFIERENEVEELKIRVSELSESKVETTQADLLNARAQGITDSMFKLRTELALLVFSGEEMSSVPDVASSPLQPVDFWDQRCLHTPTSTHTPRSLATLHCSGFSIWSRSRSTSSSPC